MNNSERKNQVNRGGQPRYVEVQIRTLRGIEVNWQLEKKHHYLGNDVGVERGKFLVQPAPAENYRNDDLNDGLKYPKRK